MVSIARSMIMKMTRCSRFNILSASMNDIESSLEIALSGCIAQQVERYPFFGMETGNFIL